MSLVDLAVGPSDGVDPDVFYKRYYRKSLQSIQWRKNAKEFVLEEERPEGRIMYLTLNIRARVKTVKDFRFEVSLSDLVTLNLDNNSLTAFPKPELFKHMPSLKTLILSHNKIDEVPGESLAMIAEFRSLTMLDLSNNLLKTLPRTIGLLTTLTALRLESNQLEELPKEITSLLLLDDTRLSFNIKGNNLKTPNQKLAESGGWRTIRFALTNTVGSPEDHFWIRFNEYYNNQTKQRNTTEKTLKNATLQVKLHVLGGRGAGKTRLVNSLIAKNEMEVISGTKSHLDPPLKVPSLEESRHDATHRAPSANALGLSISFWHPRLRPLDEAIQTKQTNKDAPSLHALTYGAQFVGRVWDLSGGLSCSYNMHRILMTDCSVFVVAWDIRNCTERDWEDNVVRYVRFVLSSGVANYKIVVVATHADLLNAEDTMATTAALKEYLQSAGCLQYVDDVILPAHGSSLMFVFAQLALAIIKHGTSHTSKLLKQGKDDKVVEKFHGDLVRYCCLQNLHSVLRRHSMQSLPATDSRPVDLDQKTVLKEMEKLQTSALNLTRMGDALYFRLLNQDFLFKADWLAGKLKRLFDRSAHAYGSSAQPLQSSLRSSPNFSRVHGDASVLLVAEKPGVLTREAVERLLQDEDVTAMDHPKMLRCLFVSLGLLVPLSESSASPSIPPARSADDIALLSGTGRLNCNRNVTDGLVGGSPDIWSSEGMSSPAYIVPLLLPVHPADMDHCRPGHICLERMYIYSAPDCILTSSWFTVACVRSMQYCQKFGFGLPEVDMGSFGWSAWDRAFLLEFLEKMDLKVFATMEEHGRHHISAPSIAPRTSADSLRGLGLGAEPHLGIRSSDSRTSLGSHSTSGKSAAPSYLARTVIRVRAFCDQLSAQIALRVVDAFCSVLRTHLAYAHHMGRVFIDPTLARPPLSSDVNSAHVHCEVTCPECLQTYRSPSQDQYRGHFTHDEIQLWENEYRKDPPGALSVSSTNSSAPAGPAGQRRPAYDKPTAEHFYNLSKRRILCPKRRCAIRPDLLFDIPTDVLRCIEQSKQFTQSSRFLCDEVIRVGMSKVAASAVKIMVATVLKDDLTRFLASSSSTQLTNDRTMLMLKPKSVCSGVVCSVPLRAESCQDDPSNVSHINPGTEAQHGVFVVTCEHAFTECLFDQQGLRYSYKDKFLSDELAVTFLVGDESTWLYMAEVVYQGSSHSNRDRRFHDFCVLRLVCPLRPAAIDLNLSFEIVKVEAFKDWRFSRSDLHYLRQDTEQSMLAFRLEENKTRQQALREVRLKHPSHGDLGVLAVATISDRPLSSDQYLCLLSYPQNGTLSVDYGRILQHDPKDEDIVLEVLSESGSSGGPLIDVYGCVVGVLSRSYNAIKYSYVQPIRDLPAILSDCRNVFS